MIVSTFRKKCCISSGSMACIGSLPGPKRTALSVSPLAYGVASSWRKVCHGQTYLTNPWTVAENRPSQTTHRPWQTAIFRVAEYVTALLVSDHLGGFTSITRAVLLGAPSFSEEALDLQEFCEGTCSRMSQRGMTMFTCLEIIPRVFRMSMLAGTSCSI